MIVSGGGEAPGLRKSILRLPIEGERGVNRRQDDLLTGKHLCQWNIRSIRICLSGLRSNTIQARCEFFSRDTRKDSERFVGQMSWTLRHGRFPSLACHSSSISVASHVAPGVNGFLYYIPHYDTKTPRRIGGVLIFCKSWYVTFVLCLVLLKDFHFDAFYTKLDRSWFFWKPEIDS